jgi:ribonuclease HI
MLQSLNVPFHSLPKINGYYYPPVVSEENGKVMVATYINSSLTYTTVQVPIDPIDCRFSYCAVSIPTKRNKPVSLINVYYPEGSTKKEQVAWLTKLSPSDGSWIVAGDFNVSNYLWDSGAPRGAGEHLADTIMDSFLTELNDGSITRLGQTNQRDSAIDLSLASADISSLVHWNTLDDSLQSDHLPIFINFENVYSTQAEIDDTPTYLYDKANWDVFESLLSYECSLNDPYDDNIDAYLENIRTMILRSADTAIPKFSVTGSRKHQNYTEWWNTECDNACAKKRKAMRDYKKNATHFNKEALISATKSCEETILASKSSYWEKLCLEKMNEPKDSSKIWTKIKSFQHKYKVPEKPLLTNGHQTANNLEKAEILAQTFAQNSTSTSCLSADALKFRKEKEKHFCDPIPNNSDIFNQDLSFTDLKLAINGLSSKGKATGKDPISNKMIRHFPEKFLHTLLLFFQTCWSKGYIPSSWKDALVVAVPKPGKPKHLATSYRPIALTPHLCKLYERIIKLRLEHFLSSKNILPVCQAGFQKRRSCMEHVVHLVEHAKRAITNRQTTVTTFFDIKSAFDRVWHAKLLHKISQLKISGRMYSFIKVFIENRTIAVKVGSSISRVHTLDMGVPQGSVIAPLLFCIMLHDIEEKVSKPGLFLSLFADDLAVWADCNGTIAKRRKSWLLSYQTIIDNIISYMAENGFELSPDKTNLMVFTRQLAARKDFKIIINGCQITHSISTKFLGVILHQDLLWNSHTKYILSKARRGVSVIKSLCHTSWITPKSLLHLTHALVRSRLMYGHEVSFTKSDSDWLSLERIELRALKAILGVPIYAVNDLVYQLVDWLPLRKYCKLLSVGFKLRTDTTPNNVSSVITDDFSSNDDVFRQRLAKSKPKIHKVTTPFSSYTKDITAIVDKQPTCLQQSSTPSWALKQPKVDYKYAEKYTKVNDQLLITTIAKERIENYYSSHVKYYTDGSVLDTKDSGCAFVTPELKTQQNFRLNKGVSVFSAELYAIHMACLHINSLKSPPKEILILSDSKSVLQALERGGTQNRSASQKMTLKLIHNILEKNVDITLMWIPSHSNFRGNDIADCMAKSAAITGDLHNIGLSVKEKMSIARQIFNQHQELYLKNKCKDKGWLHVPGLFKFISKLPRTHQRILNRILTISFRYKFFPCNCQCGTKASIEHLILEDCTALPHFNTLRSLRRTKHLSFKDFLIPHPALGNYPIRVLINAILSSKIASWF